MIEKTVEILVGVPTAGKSTWISTARRPTTMVISSDDIITKKAAALGGTYDQHFSDLIKGASAQAKSDFDDALTAGVRHIVVDRTNLSPKSRQYWIDKALKADYRVIARVFPTPDEDTLQKRLASRPGKTIPDHVMRSMRNRFIMPRSTEGFDEIKMVND